MSGVNLENYVEVHERIKAFYEKHAEGSLQGDWKVEVIGEQTFIVYRAQAFRDPADKRPGIGFAYEPFPGKTPYTKDSELMNAETSAWGRAIAALGFEVHRGIATASEMRNRNGGGSRNLEGEATAPQKRAITTILNQAGVSKEMQAKIVHGLAGDPPQKQGASEILDVLKGESDLDADQRIDSLIEKAGLGTSEIPVDLSDLPPEDDGGTTLEARAEPVDQHKAGEGQ